MAARFVRSGPLVGGFGGLVGHDDFNFYLGFGGRVRGVIDSGLGCGSLGVVGSGARNLSLSFELGVLHLHNGF